MLPSAKLAVIVGALCVANAFYLPGVAPREYLEGEDVEIKVPTSHQRHMSHVDVAIRHGAVRMQSPRTCVPRR